MAHRTGQKWVQGGKCHPPRRHRHPHKHHWGCPHEPCRGPPAAHPPTHPQRNTFPYIALLVQENADGSYIRWCGASLIRPRLLVTAAHCLFDDNGQRTDPKMVYIGALDLTSDSPGDDFDRRAVTVGARIDALAAGGWALARRRRAFARMQRPPTWAFTPCRVPHLQRVIKHGQYNPNSYKYDIALLVGPGWLAWCRGHHAPCGVQMDTTVALAHAPVCHRTPCACR